MKGDHMSHIRLKPYLFACAAASALIPSLAYAEEGDSAADTGPVATSSEDIVVTARRRTETLFEAPTTVTAVSGDVLRDLGITSIKEVVSLVPNVVIPDSPDNLNTYINIRGILQVDFNAEPNFGLFRNGLYMGGARTNLGSQVDIDRVEVLAGPQGGLYGRNAVGGAINIVYAMPKKDFDGYAKAAYGTYNRVDVEGAVNVPLGDKAAIRLTGWHFNQTGSETYNETLDEQVDAFTDKGLRLGVTAEIAPRVNITWAAEIQDFKGPSLHSFGLTGVNNGGIISAPETYKLIRRNTPSKLDMRHIYLAQKIAYDSDVGMFELNASYHRYDMNSIIDNDQTITPVTAGPAVRQTSIPREEEIDDFFIEGIWMSPDDKPLSWIAGLSYFDQSFDFSRIVASFADFTNVGFGPVYYEVGFPSKGTNLKTRSLSAFASLNYKFSDRFSMSAGLRWSKDEKKFHFVRAYDPASLLPANNPALAAYAATRLNNTFPPFLVDIERTFYFLSPSLGLKYQANDNLNLYATYSTGYRPGGFNASPTTFDTIPYDEESASNYEVGLKSRWLDGKLNVNLAAFYMRQKDMLLYQTASAGGLNYLYYGNVGTGDTYGVEFAADAKLASWLNANVSVGWLDARYDRAAIDQGRPSELRLDGFRIAYTREWTANARLDARYPVSSSLELIGSAAVRYEQGGVLGDYYVLDKYKAMTKIDLNAGVVIGGNTHITAYVKNLLDEHIPQFYYYNRALTATPGRTFGVSVTQNF